MKMPRLPSVAWATIVGFGTYGVASGAFAIGERLGVFQQVAGWAAQSSASHPLVSSSDCVIKSNVSIDTGERIYHVPGGLYYNATAIDTAKGERWFCTEAEAVAAGWRKSKF